MDFETIKEKWNTYNLHDGTKLKTRSMLRLVWITKDAQGSKKYHADIKGDTVVMCHASLQGEKSKIKYPPEQLQKNIDVDNCRYDTLQYEPSEYILEEGTKVLIHSNLTAIARTRLFNENGDRIYLTKNAVSTTITPMKKG